MSKFAITTNQLTNRLCLKIDGGFACHLDDADLPALYSCVGAAMAESNTAVMSRQHSKGVWEFQYLGGYAGYRCLQCSTWIYAEQSRLCDCDETHQPQEPARGNEQ